MKWFEFTADLGVGEVDKQSKAGLFSMRLYLRDVEVFGEFESPIIDKHKELLEQDYSVKKVRVNIYQCRNLPPADESGNSDPYIEVWSPDEEEVKTSVVEDSNNPIYYETREIKMEFNSLERAPPLILNIWDTDSKIFDSTNDFVGKAVIMLDKIPAQHLSNDDTIP